MLVEHWRVFVTLGIAVLGVSAVRGARNTVLPVWTESLGFDPSATSLVFGISGAIDMLLFYPAGKVMDRYGGSHIRRLRFAVDPPGRVQEHMSRFDPWGSSDNPHP